LTWRATRTGQVAAWRALRIAEHTMPLPAEGAAWVDAQVAPFAGRVGPIVLERLVDEAIVRFDPETAAHQAAQALETRHATITLEHALTELGAGVVATGHLDAVLDAADALDLDTALADLAADLAAAGDTDPLDVRRAKALGLLARGQSPTISTTSTTSDGSERSSTAAIEPRRRQVVLHVHLAQAALHGFGDGIATLHRPSGQPLGPVTLEQVYDWCHQPEAHITVRPVLDLAELITCPGYQPSPRLREQVTAITPTCAFPYCDKPAENLDLDHITPYADGGHTDSEGLAPLCRAHHRAKTHGRWSYQRLNPGEYLWTSPHHHQWITDHHGTRPVSTGPP
jgi:hypothetical protein